MEELADREYLRINDLSKDFGGLRAVDHLDLSVRKGGSLSVIGPNGAGKTTLLNLISGVLPVTEGKIWFNGRRVDKLPSYRICEMGIARTFQNLQLFSNMTVLENVMMGRHRWLHATLPEFMLNLRRARREYSEAKDRAMEKLVLLGLENRAKERPSNLALKDRKSLAIARALATEPDLLLLDEPVGGLSVEEIREIDGKLKSILDHGITLLFIEHRMEFVMGLSERVIVMEFGRKIAEGTFEEIRQDEQVIRAYLGKAGE